MTTPHSASIVGPGDPADALPVTTSTTVPGTPGTVPQALAPGDAEDAGPITLVAVGAAAAVTLMLAWGALRRR